MKTKLTYFAIALALVCLGALMWGTLKWRQVQRDLAETQARRALTEIQLARTELQLGDMIRLTGDSEKALALYQQSLMKLLRVGDKSDQAHAHGKIGHAQFDLGKYAEAQHSHQQAITLLGQGNREELALESFHLSQAKFRLGQKSEAIELLEKVLEIRDRLALENPSRNSQKDLAEVHFALGEVYLASEQVPAGLRAFEQARDIYEQIEEQALLARALREIGGTYRQLNQIKEALRFQQKSVELSKTLVARDPSHRNELARSLIELASSQSNLGNYPEAVRSYQAALQLEELVLLEQPNRVEVKRLYAITLENFGRVLEKQGKLREALTHFKKCVGVKEELAHLKAEDSQSQASLNESLADVTRLETGSRKPASGKK